MKIGLKESKKRNISSISMANNLTDVLYPTENGQSDLTAISDNGQKNPQGPGNGKSKEPTELRNFYDGLKKRDVVPNLPDFKNFKSTLTNNPNERKNFYQHLKQSPTLNLPDYQTFNTTLFGSNGEKKPKDNDSIVKNFWEGLQQAWYGSKAGAEYLVGELSDVAGAGKLGDRFKEWAEANQKKAPAPDDSWGQFLGILTGYTIPAVASIAAAPVTGGTS
jgi:hypothetical protein